MAAMAVEMPSTSGPGGSEKLSVQERKALAKMGLAAEPEIDVFGLQKEDLYVRMKMLQRDLEFLNIQEEYIRDETKHLRTELLRAQEEVKRIQSVPLVIGQFLEMVDVNNGIVGSTTGSNYYVRILSTLNRELLKPSASVALHRHSNALVDILPPEADSSISLMTNAEKPDVSYTVRRFASAPRAARACATAAPRRPRVPGGWA